MSETTMVDIISASGATFIGRVSKAQTNKHRVVIEDCISFIEGPQGKVLFKALHSGTFTMQIEYPSNVFREFIPETSPLACAYLSALAKLRSGIVADVRPVQAPPTGGPRLVS